MNKESNVRSTRLYVDLNAIACNVSAVREKLGHATQIMAIVKASGYGSGVVEIVKTLINNGVNRLGVAIAEEGIHLREQGVELPILVLTQPLDADLEKFVEYDLIPTISDMNLADKLNVLSKNKNKVTKLHVEVDTGIGRIGIQADKAAQFIANIDKLENIQVEGVFTHFACADWDVEYTRLQIYRFEKTLEELKEMGIDIPLKHACNSAATVNYPEAHYDLVRPGLILYGYYPDECLKDRIKLQPSLTLKSRVAFIKEVPSGTSISYNRTFTTEHTSKIVTIPIGYADGYRRELSNKGFVIINSVKAPIAGVVCMDVIMADVTHIPGVKVGDEVIIFDSENITVDEIAKICGTINYEIIASISSRVPRVYVNL